MRNNTLDLPMTDNGLPGCPVCGQELLVDQKADGHYCDIVLTCPDLECGWKAVEEDPHRTCFEA